jgi:TolA-binding protein
MRIFLLFFILSALLQQPLIAAGDINVDKVIVNHNKKIQKLNKRYKSLLNEIDQLKEHQNIGDAKIMELFHLLEFKQTQDVVKQTVTQIKRDNIIAKKLYTDARSLLLTDQYNQAVELFQKYLNEYPENNNADDAHYWLARSYVALQDFENAKNTFISFQQENPRHHKFSNSFLELSRVYAELEENELAIELINLMIKKTPHHNSINQAKQLLAELTAPSEETSE